MLCLLLVLQNAAVLGAATVRTQTPSSSDVEQENEGEDPVVSGSGGYAPPSRHSLPTRPGTSRQMNLMSTATTTMPSRQSLARNAVYAPIRRDHDNNNNSHRMQDYSLAQQMEFLSQSSKNNSNDGTNHGKYFEMLLQMETKEQQKQLTTVERSSLNNQSKAIITTPVVSPLFWSILGSASALAFSSWLWDPKSAQTLWKTVVGKKIQAVLAVAWLPWVWAHPSQLALADLLVLIQLVRQPAVLPYLQAKVLPVVFKTCKAMIVAEIWSRGWKWFFWHLETVRQSILEKTAGKDEWGKTGNNEAGTTGVEDLEGTHNFLSLGRLSWPAEPPSWLVEAHNLVIGGIRKGIKSSAKKSIQETITASFTVWINAIEEQLMVDP